ncbi:hypothetical protein OHA25_04875 [Nonomuraea sp. NBC_00507]|uniref:hypothetical protein n=1 Tax=Nonomuraea sp. NBC_00507 TaxID=2976002 RepID=UPI002E16FAA2
MSRSRSQFRNPRNNPYQTHDRTMVTVSNSAAGSLWRWRTELILFALVVLATAFLGNWVNATWNLTGWPLLLVALGAWLLPFAALFAVVPIRRWFFAHAWCLITRHRLQRLCHEAHRLHTKAGRLPLILWIRPTSVGERAHLWLRAGICVEDIEAHISEIRTACYARDARVQVNPRWTHLVTLDIIRRDTLAASTTIVPLIRDRQNQASSDA